MMVRPTGEVPPELANPDDPVWADLGEVLALAKVYGLDYEEPAPSLMRDPYWQRFAAFRLAYAERFGYMSTEWPNTLDLDRLRAAGVYAASRAPRWRLLSDGSVVPTSPPSE